MNISVFTLIFGDLTYAALTRQNNQRYCERHGLPFVVAAPDDPPLSDRNPIWYKVRRAAELLPTCDYLLYLDADAYFWNHAIPLTALIDVLAEGTMLLSVDPPWSNVNANTGGWLIRNCAAGRAILAEWWDVPLTHPACGHEWPIEQKAFNEVVRPAREGIKTVDVSWLNGKGGDGDFIRHPCGPDLKAKMQRISSDLLK